MNQILEEISNIGVVPVVAIDHKDDAAPLADAFQVLPGAAKNGMK